MLSRRFAAILAFVTLAAVPVFAKPNFTGAWKVNSSKSDFGQFPGGNMTAKIAHEDPKLKSTITQEGPQGEFTMESTYTTDGKESTNEGFGGAPMKAVAKWDGDILNIESKGQFGDNEFTMVDKYELSADGKTLTINRTFKSAMGEMIQKLVFDKQ
jgi:hypothetical protein